MENNCLAGAVVRPEQRVSKALAYISNWVYKTPERGKIRTVTPILVRERTTKLRGAVSSVRQAASGGPNVGRIVPNEELQLWQKLSFKNGPGGKKCWS